MSQTAETLRAMAQEQQEYADALHFDPEDAALNTARKAACEAGARAWEIVERLANIRPELSLIHHDIFPLWKDAFKLVHEPASAMLDADGR